MNKSILPSSFLITREHLARQLESFLETSARSVAVSQQRRQKNTSKQMLRVRILSHADHSRN
jgi:hypothetical protein